MITLDLHKYIVPILLFYSHLLKSINASKHPFQKGIGLLPSLKAYIPHPTANGTAQPSTVNCTLHWYKQPINHFSPSPSSETFHQRYFTNTNYWKPGDPILLYTGNEANVELYINATGFMWENAPHLNAALLFIEHRYYGQSLPYNTSQQYDMTHDQLLQYLTVEQALKDYISILSHFKMVNNAKDSPVIALGGSYGGMLSAWIRMKYPNHVDGAIASSAPLLAFFDQDEEGKNGDALTSFHHGESYWQIVTHDASKPGGSVDECAANVHTAFHTLLSLSSTSQNLQTLSNIFHLCDDDDDEQLQNAQDVQKLALMLMMAWDIMAMGNYPFPSNYLIFQDTKDVNVKLPSFPVRAACEYMSGTFHHINNRNDVHNDANNNSNNNINENDIKLLSALRDAAAVYYNATGATQCYNLPSDINFDGIWDYQYCTQLLPQETYFQRDGVHDMFWPFTLHKSDIEQHCAQTFPSLGTNKPNWSWFQNMYQQAKKNLTNVVFTNGAYDPWSAGGIPPPGLSELVPSFVIEQGAHHLDLMFSDVEHDPVSVVEVREIEVGFIKKWIREKKKKGRVVKEGLLRGVSSAG